MKQIDRLVSIDALRALGIIVMILTHVLSWHFGEYGIGFIWNAIHMVVVGLVFCSAYLYSKANSDEKIHHRFKWFTKRIARLYIPFIFYLIAHYTMWLLFPEWLRGYGIKQSLPFIASSVSLSGGVDIGWLTTLFIQMAIIFPFLLSLSRSKKYVLFTTTLLIVFSTITAIFRIPMDYTRLIGWLPWSLVSLIGFMYSDMETLHPGRLKKFTTSALALCFATYTLFYFIFRTLHMSVQLTHHKYPPDIFYLSYGLFFTFILITLFRRYELFLHPVKKYITFISRQSYTIFFVHIIVLDIVMTKMAGNWLSEFVVISVVSLVCTYGIHAIQAAVRRHASKSASHG